MATPPPSDEDRQAVVELVLHRLGDGSSFDDLVAEVRPFAREHDTFPSEQLLELAADALADTGVSRSAPLPIADLSGSWPYRVSGRTHHAKTDSVIRTVAMVHAGIEPDLIDETGWWRSNDLWFHSLAALPAVVVAVAPRSGGDVAAVCDRLRRCVAPPPSATGSAPSPDTPTPSHHGRAERSRT